MEIKRYKFYKDYLKKRNINNEQILISKTKDSYLIGPKINLEFDEQSFYKRTISSSIYDINIYKNILKKRAEKLIQKYIGKLGNNEIIELYKDGTYVIHSIIPIPGEKYEKE